MFSTGSRLNRWRLTYCMHTYICISHLNPSQQSTIRELIPFFLTLLLLHLETDELYQVSFHILILSGRREKTLMEKVSLSLCRPSERRGLHPVYCWAAAFSSAEPDRKSVRPVSDVNLHPSMTGDSVERPGENWRIDRLVQTIQRNRWAEGAGRFSYLPPFPPTLKTATCFKEQNFIKLCHSVFVSQRRREGRGAGDVCLGVVEGSELCHRRAINSALPSVLVSCIRKQQVVTVRSHDDTTPGTWPNNEGVNTHTHTIKSIYTQRYMHTHKHTSGGRSIEICLMKKYPIKWFLVFIVQFIYTFTHRQICWTPTLPFYCP